MLPLLQDRLPLIAAAVDGAPDTVCLYREAAGAELVYANRALERITGWTREEAIAQRLQVLDVDAVGRVLHGDTVTVAATLTRKNGTQFDAEVIAWPIDLQTDERYFMCLLRVADRRSLERSLLDFSAALESSADMVLITERMTEPLGWAIIYANAAFVSETGYTLAELAGVTPTVFLGKTDPGILQAGMQASRRDEEVRMDVPITRKDGSWFWGAWRGRTIDRSEGHHRRVITIRNITDRIVAAERFAAHSDRLRQLHLVAASSGRSADRQIGAILEFGTEAFDLESAFAGSIVDGLFTWEHLAHGCNRAPERVRVGERIPVDRMALRFAIETDDVFASQDLRVERIFEPNTTHFNPLLRSYIAAPLIVRGRHYGGVGFVSRNVRQRPFDADDRDIMRLIAALVGSATERGIGDKRLDALAFYDTITGLPNRVLLDDRLKQTLASAKRGKRQFALLALDLDRFKEVNDRGGHAEGDEALKIVASRLSSALRESDTLGRVGGDEFIALQPVIEDEADALRFAERLCGALRDPIRVGENSYQIGVTIGIALFDRDGGDVQTLLRNADRALYAAKAKGRGQIEFARPNA